MVLYEYSEGESKGKLGVRRLYNTEMTLYRCLKMRGTGKSTFAESTFLRKRLDLKTAEP